MWTISPAMRPSSMVCPAHPSKRPAAGTEPDRAAALQVAVVGRGPGVEVGGVLPEAAGAEELDELLPQAAASATTAAAQASVQILRRTTELVTMDTVLPPRMTVNDRSPPLRSGHAARALVRVALCHAGA